MNFTILLAISFVHYGISEKSREKSSFIYDNPEKTYTILMYNNWITSGPIPPKTYVAGQSRFALEETFGFAITDCSSEKVRCWVAEDINFALPNDTREIKGEFVTSAGIMVMEECLRGHDTQCQIMRLRMDSAKFPEFSTYYVYNEDYGIVSFGIAGPGEKPHSPAEAAAIANQYILQGERGLFAPPGKKNTRR